MESMIEIVALNLCGVQRLCKIQSSLRVLTALSTSPSAELLGYYRASLRGISFGRRARLGGDETFHLYR